MTHHNAIIAAPICASAANYRTRLALYWDEHDRYRRREREGMRLRVPKPEMCSAANITLTRLDDVILAVHPSRHRTVGDIRRSFEQAACWECGACAEGGSQGHRDEDPGHHLWEGGDRFEFH